MKKTFLLLGLAFLFMPACAEQVGSGKAVSIPSIILNCETSNCKALATGNAFIHITTTSCDWNFLEASSAVSSAVVSCNPTTGCRYVSSGWTGGDHLPTTTISSGTYTVCGHVTPPNLDPADPSTHGSKVEIPNVTFVDNMGVIQLGGSGGQGTWVNY